MSIAKFFEELEVASYNMEVSQAVECETSQFVASETCFECSSEVANCMECTAAAADSSSTNSTSNSSDTTNYNSSDNSTDNLTIDNIVVSCTKCTAYSYLETVHGGIICTLCVSAIDNCFECTNATVCTICKFGYVPSTNGSACVLEPSCDVSNCKLCASDNSTKCSGCYGDYTMSSDGATCTEPTCEGSQVFDGLVCGCQDGFFIDGTACSACP